MRTCFYCQCSDFIIQGFQCFDFEDNKDKEQAGIVLQVVIFLTSSIRRSTSSGLWVGCDCDSVFDERETVSSIVSTRFSSLVAYVCNAE